MEYLTLGKNGPKVSRLGLGTMMMGWRMDLEESIEVLATARAHGITFLDSSVSYARGGCHTILGSALGALKARDDFILATKVGGRSSDQDPPEFTGLSEFNIFRQCNLSLSQLKVDYIDVLQLHVPSDDVPIEEQLWALEKLRSEGKIRYYGFCNYTLKQAASILNAATALGLNGLISHQLTYNLLDQAGKIDLLDQCKTSGLGSIIWGPLASGLLTDWYGDNFKLKEGSRISNGRERDDKQKLLSLPSSQLILESLKRESDECGLSIQNIAINWLLENPLVTTVLLGPSNNKQLVELLER